MLFGGGFLRERPGQHELGFKDRAARIYQAVQSRRHPFGHRMPDPLLNVLYGLTGVALVPTPVEVLGDPAELDN